MDKFRKINIFLCFLYIIASHCDFRLSSHIFLLWVLFNIYNLYKDKNLNLIKEYYINNKIYINSILVFFMLPFIAVILHGLPSKELSEWSSQFRGEIIGIILPLLFLKNGVSISKILKLSILMVNISMFYGYYKYFILGFDRLSSFITDNPNVYSMYLLILFCVMSYALYYFKEPMHRILIGFTMANIFLSLVIAMSRGCVLLFFIYLIIFLIYKLRRNLKLLITTLCIIGIGFSGVLVANPSFSNRIVRTITDPKIDSERYIIYDTSINIIKDNWFTGIGKGNLEQTYEKYNEYKDINNKTFYHTHQIFLEMMINSGIFGLIAFLWFIIFQFKVFFKEYFQNNANKVKQYAALMCLFITGIVFTYMQVENVYFALRKIYWIYIGLGYYILIKKNIAEYK